jgi:hypothetical protein
MNNRTVEIPSGFDLNSANEPGQNNPAPRMLGVKHKDLPKPSKKVYHGIAGEIVEAIEPETESDPIALLISLFVAFGNIIGRNSYYEVEATRHYANLFVVGVGESSRGRKGTSWNIIKRPLSEIDSDWAKLCVKSGLSSGEGLIYNVRDRSEHTDSKGNIQADEGVSDKRLFIYQSEFASVLKVANRPGNSLTATIRDAWDTGNLSTLTKYNPTTASNAHISILGHVTKEELIRNLNETEAANGFANRFLWVFFTRSKKLPFGGNIQLDGLLIPQLQDAITFARTERSIQMSTEAKAVWADIYNKLSDTDTGLLGAITSRAEAQMVRLALIYALLESSDEILPDHLIAAKALWDYCFDSARYVFGDRFGDPVADTIFEMLRPSNTRLSTTDIHRRFGNNKTKIEIERGLSYLLDKNKIKQIVEQTTGRPVTFYERNERNELSPSA